MGRGRKKKTWAYFALYPLARVVLLGLSVSKHRILICITMAGVLPMVDRP